jgi:glycosyltransferase involved in cell wall biosynthesis
MRIALFTPFPPTIGGGATLLKSLLPELSELNIQWYYLKKHGSTASSSNCLGTRLMGGPLLQDALRSCTLWIRPGSSAVDKIAHSMSADLYWVVAADEGVLVGLSLAASGKPVHVTVHDDPVCLFSRTKRYRHLVPFMSKAFSQLLKAAVSVDVVSEEMREFYQQQADINSLVVFRYVKQLKKFAPRKPREGPLLVGHIGTIYSELEFRRFIEALRTYGEKVGKTVRVLKIGRSREFEKVQADHGDIIDDRGDLCESTAIEALAECDFLYAMYPHGSRHEVFRKTSLPTKLTTYIQAQRPILAHSPADSGLARVVKEYGIGTVCSSLDQDKILEAVGECCQADVNGERYETIRSELLGVSHVTALRDALSHAQ